MVQSLPARIWRAMRGAFDKAPAWVQHLAVAFVGAAVADFYAEVQAGHPLGSDVVHALVAGAGAAVAVVVAMAGLPFTTQYGVGAATAGDQVPAAAPPAAVWMTGPNATASTATQQVGWTTPTTSTANGSAGSSEDTTGGVE